MVLPHFFPNFLSDGTSQLQPESSQVTSEVEYVAETSTSTFQVVKAADTIYSFSLMQCICPWITLGGLGSFSQKASDLSFSYGGIISHNEHQVFFQWDKEVSCRILSYERCFVLWFSLRMDD
jgi:hypothetical protein